MNLNNHRLWAASALLVGCDAVAATLGVPADFATIQAAINAAAPGDTVEVSTGTYRENLVLADNVDVRGVEAARTFLEARDTELPVVTGTGVTDLLFANFTIRSSADGVRLIDSTGITLASNVFDGLDGIGVFVGTLSSVEIVNNVFYRNNVSIDRFTTAAPVTNNIFSENSFTVASSSIIPISPDFDVSYNCFYRNNDLQQSGVDAGLGTNFQVGNPQFVDPAAQDFHLRAASICIDAGTGNDVIDDSVADIGAYGGDFADAMPFPVNQPVASDASSSNPVVYRIDVEWDANLDYRITNDAMPGGYKLWYALNLSGPPYNGDDAGGGTEPSPVPVGDVTTYTLENLAPDAAAPGVPTLVSASPRNNSVRLDWNRATGAGSYRIYYGVAEVTENTVSVGNVTSSQVAGLDNGTEYSFAVSAVVQPTYYLSVTAVDNTTNRNESDFSAEDSIAVGSPVEGLLSNVLKATPDEVTPYPDLPDEGCFIATAAFGADWMAEVRVLRQFRDRFLLTNLPGRAFVGWYYRSGPRAAHFLQTHAYIKPWVRASLWPLIVLAAFLLGAGPLEVFAACLSSLILLLVLVRRRIRWPALSRNES
jgi:hypothetical protein